MCLLTPLPPTLAEPAPHLKQMHMNSCMQEIALANAESNPLKLSLLSHANESRG